MKVRELMTINVKTCRPEANLSQAVKDMWEGDCGALPVVDDEGHVTGVITEALLAREVGHRGLTELRVVKTMHERKAAMADLSEGFVALPGGFGTIDELTECLTLVQTGKSRKIPIILVGGEFWQGLIGWMRDKLVGEGMISPADLELMQVIEEPEAIVEAIFDYYETRGFQPTLAERDKMLNL